MMMMMTVSMLIQSWNELDNHYIHNRMSQGTEDNFLSDIFIVTIIVLVVVVVVVVDVGCSG